MLAAVAGYVSYRADVKRAVPYPWLTASLRGIVVLLTLLLLLTPVFTVQKHETRKPIVLFLQDDSRSVGVALDKDSVTYKDAAGKLLDKLAGKYQVVTWNLEGKCDKDSLFGYKNESTDLSSALNKVQEYYGTQNLGAVVLATDGRYNQGVNPVHQQLSFKGALYTIGIGDTDVQKDLRVAQVYANKTVTMNNSFEVRADVVADKCKGYNNTVRITEDGNTIANATLSINGDKFDRSVSFTIRADKPGLHHYVITAPAADGEANTVNNRRDVFVEVIDEQKHILIAGLAPHPDIKAIKEALAGLDNYKITVRVNNDFPSLPDDYDILVLHQLPGQGYSGNTTIMRSNKPTWIILGRGTDNAALGSLDKPVASNITPGALRNVFAAYNPTFNSFNLPQNIRAVVDKFPPIAIPGGKIQLVPGAQALFVDKGSDVPLWALRQGRKPTAIIAGDGLWRWRMYEYKNFGNTNTIDECIRQTMSFLSTDNTGKPFSVTLPKYIWSDQEAISFNAYLRNANGEAINEPEVKVSIRDSSGNEMPYTFERSGNAYQLNIGIRAGGTYAYTAHAVYNGNTYTSSGNFMVETIPLELMETGADYAMLYSLAEYNNGAFFPSSKLSLVYDSIATNDNIKPIIETNIETVPLIDRKWFFLLILLFAVAEWLLRKYWLAQ
ncbi:MAG: hypothetical protein H6550_14625 [Chitinophagales bacterium]|nr:hypothetical protein [Chitinophagales bacterium]